MWKSGVVEPDKLTIMRLNLLPGPLDVDDELRRLFSELPGSHRSKKFISDFEETSDLLCKLAGAENVQLLSGSGTLANDVVAGQLSLLQTNGIVLSNGEFGNRLIDHAQRFQLSFDTLCIEPGLSFDFEDLTGIVEAKPDLDWIWMVHCETSTGILNDLETLKKLCLTHGIKLCLDCVSSIGNVPLDLSDVYLTSGSVSKGLGSFPGCSFVFFQEALSESTKSLPRYLDLGYYQSNQRIPFTFFSGHLYTLKRILERFDINAKYQAIKDISKWVRSRLTKIGYYPIVSEELSSPAVITLQIPVSKSSISIGDYLAENQIFTSYESAYLIEKNWIQVCLMGKHSKEQIEPLFECLDRLCLDTRSLSLSFNDKN